MIVPSPFQQCLDEGFLKRYFESRYRHWLVEPSAHIKQLDYEADRFLKALLEDDQSIVLSEAVLRALLAHKLYWQHGVDFVLTAASTMAWGVRRGVIEPNGDHTLWKVLRPGVAYVPRGDGSLDARGNAPGGGWSMAALTRREQRGRDAKTVATKRAMYRHILFSLKHIDPEALLPARPSGSHLPPVATIGELLDNIGGFWEHMPRWALAELRTSIDRRHGEYQPIGKARPAVAPAHELDDFEL